jgi:hypothetical protein
LLQAVEFDDHNLGAAKNNLGIKKRGNQINTEKKP